MRMTHADPPPDRRSLAADHLHRARAAREQEDWTAAVQWAALALEVSVAATAARAGIDDRQDHRRRATLARRLHEQGKLPEDLGDLLIRLNTERNHAVHEGKSPDLRGRDWDAVLDSIERAVEAAQADY
jgi:HEPN domain-containing protein